jgi:ATP-dependent RNA helicase DHX57
MGKSKSKSKDSAAAAAAAKKCTCEHDFNCECGNRPPRPSRGHKWDSEAQAWGGKGHKQKGGSGQTKFVAESAKTTEKGKTSVAQWQQLPSQLLQEVCKRQRRPPPKFKNIETKGSVYKYRCIVPDPKESDKDLFFVPSHSVGNDEQSKEEAALLALLDLTPKLPHERKLPEPYKTTWLNAVKAAAAASSQQKSKAKTSNGNSSSITHATATNNTQTSHTTTINNNNSQIKPSGGAQASSILTTGKTYSSTAEKRKQQEAKRQERNTRVRRHEAVRMANQDHPVFMSAQIRKQIEGILRGDSSFLQDDGGDDELDDLAQDTEDDVQVYVMMRLHGEGFTKRHVRTAYKELPESLKYNARADENVWDKVYEESLQWLLVHLNEDQLPEGFDPRGRTLDVVVPVQQQTKAKQDVNSSSDQDTNNNVDENAVLLASRYGLSIRDASAVQQRALKEKIPVKDALWMFVKAAANVSFGNDTGADDADPGRNREIVQDELEALEAIFASECKVVSLAGWTTVSVSIEDGAMLLEVVVQDGVYPAAYPKSVLVSGKWPSRQGGAAVHLEVGKFVASLELGEPMIFEIHGHVQVMLQSMMDGELPAISLLQSESPEAQQTASKETDKAMNKKNDKGRDGTEKIRASRAPAIRRPRVRGHFWSTPPQKTPAAIPFPKIALSIQRTRHSLPAATARAEFLAVMKKADQVRFRSIILTTSL